MLFDVRRSHRNARICCYWRCHIASRRPNIWSIGTYKSTQSAATSKYHWTDGCRTLTMQYSYTNRNWTVQMHWFKCDIHNSHAILHRCNATNLILIYSTQRFNTQEAGTKKLKIMQKAAAFRRHVQCQEWTHKQLKMKIDDQKNYIKFIEKCKVKSRRTHSLVQNELSFFRIFSRWQKKCRIGLKPSNRGALKIWVRARSSVTSRFALHHTSACTMNCV